MQVEHDDLEDGVRVIRLKGRLDLEGTEAARTLEEAAPGGRGLLLVRSIAPRVRYELRDGVNRTIIGFPLDPRSAPGSA